MEEKKESKLSEIFSSQFKEGSKIAPDLASMLNALTYKKTGQYFLNQTIHIDGYTFEKCRFDKCTLVTHKGTFRFIHCVISADTIIQYGSEAFKIAKLFNSQHPYRNSVPNFLVTDNTDGTFTLE